MTQQPHFTQEKGNICSHRNPYKHVQSSTVHKSKDGDNSNVHPIVNGHTRRPAIQGYSATIKKEALTHTTVYTLKMSSG